MITKSVIPFVDHVSQKALATAFSLVLALSGLATPANAAPLKQLQIPAGVSATKRVNPEYDYQPDILLVMPDAKSKKDDINDILEQAHGTVVGSIGEGSLRCLIIRTEHGKLEETEKKFSKDKKHFAAIGRNYRIQANIVPNDPDFPRQWHLPAINCPRAWDRSVGGTKIAIFDTGCQASIADLSGKTEKGFDATTVGARLLGAGGGIFGWIPGVSDLVSEAAVAASGGAQTDSNGHGTWVATTAAGSFNDRAAGCGVAPGARIFPVRIANAGRGGTAMADDLTVMAAMMVAMNRGAKVINISYNAPYVGFHNAALHAPLHAYFAQFYTLRNGLIFMSSGNDGVFDPTPPSPYLNIVSGVDPTGKLADFGGGKGSNWGPSVTFTGPATGIWVSDIDGTSKNVQGTSFSSPIVAAEAALIWDRNPLLPNSVVQTILKTSCISVSGSLFNPYYGWGMPDAARAVGAL